MKLNFFPALLLSRLFFFFSFSCLFFLPPPLSGCVCSVLTSLHFPRTHFTQLPSSSTKDGILFQQHIAAVLGFNFHRNPFALPLQREKPRSTGTVIASSGMGNGGYTYVPGRNYDMDIERLSKAECALLEEEARHTEQPHREHVLPAFLKADLLSGTSSSLNKSMERYRHFPTDSVSLNEKGKGEDDAGEEDRGRRRRSKKGRRRRNGSPGVGSGSRSRSRSRSRSSSRSPKKKNRTTPKNMEKKQKKQETTITPGSWRKESEKEIPNPDVAEQLKKEGMKQWERIFGLNNKRDDDDTTSLDDDDTTSLDDEEQQMDGHDKERQSLPPSPSVVAEQHREHALATPPHDEWQRFFDDESNSFYFHNSAREKSTWVRPKGWKTPSRGSIAPLPMVDNDETTDWHALAKESPIKRRKGWWTEHVDEESGAFWYHNSKTGQSTWEKPESPAARSGGSGRRSDEEAWVEYNWRPPQEEVVAEEIETTREMNFNNKVDEGEAGGEEGEGGTTDWEKLRASSPVKRRRGWWSEHVDEESGAYWYHNAETGASSWDEPSEWQIGFHHSEKDEVSFFLKKTCFYDSCPFFFFIFF